ncbi:MAG: hypothetical protein DHS20C18_46420 [Saprospiraceae bacterium]|nr:MAG: hypothetical protein DHS20C18_46420 [Saprospiraceae bacterium]
MLDTNPNCIYENSGGYFDLNHHYWDDMGFVHLERICPTLVTDAKLRVLRNDLSIEELKTQMIFVIEKTNLFYVLIYIEF